MNIPIVKNSLRNLMISLPESHLLGVWTPILEGWLWKFESFCDEQSGLCACLLRQSPAQFIQQQKQQNERKEKGDWLKICLSLWGQILLSCSLPLQIYSLKAGISQDRILGRLRNPHWIARQKAFKRDKPGWKYPYEKWGLGRKLSKADASRKKLSDHGGRGVEELSTELELPATQRYHSAIWRDPLLVKDSGGLIRGHFFVVYHGRCVGKKVSCLNVQEKRKCVPSSAWKNITGFEKKYLALYPKSYYLMPQSINLNWWN